MYGNGKTTVKFLHSNSKVCLPLYFALVDHTILNGDFLLMEPHKSVQVHNWTQWNLSILMNHLALLSILFETTQTHTHTHECLSIYTIRMFLQVIKTYRVINRQTQGLNQTHTHAHTYNSQTYSTNECTQFMLWDE